MRPGGLSPEVRWTQGLGEIVSGNGQGGSSNRPWLWRDRHRLESLSYSSKLRNNILDLEALLLQSLDDGIEVALLQAHVIGPPVTPGGSHGQVEDLAAGLFDNLGGRLQGLGLFHQEQVQAGALANQAQQGKEGADYVQHSDHPYQP